MIELIIVFCCVFVVTMFKGDNSSNNSRVKEYHGFDWDAYWKDIENGIDIMDQLKKKERGDYWITDPNDKRRNKWY